MSGRVGAPRAVTSAAGVSIWLLAAATVLASDTGAPQQGATARRRVAEGEKDAAVQLDRLIEDLGNPDPDVRQEAACAVGERGAEGGRAVEALIRALEMEVRSTAPGALRGNVSCYGLSWARGRWKSFQEMVSDMRRANEARARRRLPVPWALHETHGAERAAAAVVNLLRREPGLRFVPADTADLLGALGPGAVPALSRAAAGEPNAQIRWIAVVALGRIEPTTKAAVAAIKRVLAEQSGEVQQEAAQVLEDFEARYRK
jgi:hypothetical protein